MISDETDFVMKILILPMTNVLEKMSENNLYSYQMRDCWNFINIKVQLRKKNMIFFKIPVLCEKVLIL